MTLETKYDNNQEVFFMEQNRAVSGLVESVVAQSVTFAGGKPRVHVKYTLRGKNDAFLESQLFPTKEALLASL